MIKFTSRDYHEIDIFIALCRALIWGFFLGVIFATYGCSIPHDETAPSIQVSVPVDNSPEPPVIAPPHEWVYDLTPDATPDAIERYQELTIIDLERAWDECNGALGAYRRPQSPVKP